MQSAFNDAMAGLAEIAEDLKKAADLAEAAKIELTLINKATLRRMGLSTADIKKIPAVYLAGRAHPVFKKADVEEYIESRKF